MFEPEHTDRKKLYRKSLSLAALTIVLNDPRILWSHSRLEVAVLEGEGVDGRGDGADVHQLGQHVPHPDICMAELG